MVVIMYIQEYRPPYITTCKIVASRFPFLRSLLTRGMSILKAPSPFPMQVHFHHLLLEPSRLQKLLTVKLLTDSERSAFPAAYDAALAPISVKTGLQ